MEYSKLLDRLLKLEIDTIVSIREIRDIILEEERSKEAIPEEENTEEEPVINSFMERFEYNQKRFKGNQMGNQRKKKREKKRKESERKQRLKLRGSFIKYKLRFKDSNGVYKTRVLRVRGTDSIEHEAIYYLLMETGDANRVFKVTNLAGHLMAERKEETNLK